MTRFNYWENSWYFFAKGHCNTLIRLHKQFPVSVPLKEALDKMLKELEHLRILKEMNQ